MMFAVFAFEMARLVLAPRFVLEEVAAARAAVCEPPRAEDVGVEEERGRVCVGVGVGVDAGAGDAADGAGLSLGTPACVVGVLIRVEGVVAVGGFTVVVVVVVVVAGPAAPARGVARVA